MDTQALLKESSATHLRGDLAAAEAGYRIILAHEPHNADALFLMATLYLQRGDFGQAVPLLKGLLKVNPAHRDAWQQLAHALLESGDGVEAADCYVSMLARWPDHVQAYLGLGEISLAQGRLDTATQAFEQALKFVPDLPVALFNLGLINYQLKVLDAAETYYRRYLNSEPDSLQGHFNLGAVLHDLHRLDEAQAEYRWALKIDARSVEAHRGLGNIALYERRYGEAIEHFRAGLAYAPHDVELLSNLGVMLQKLNMMDEAEQVLQQAIALNPEHINAHFNLALVLLLKGNFFEGWKEYEWRLKIKSRSPVRFIQPEWDGADLVGKSILLRAEQGFGDTFQFVRYAPQVKAAGGRVIFECQPELKRLLLRTPGLDVIAERPVSEVPLVSFDCHLPLLSLPRIFDTGFDTIPSALPYIYPETWLTERWAARLAQDKQRRIGIVWAGRPAHEDDLNRSCTLAHFSALSCVPNVTLYSLQKGGRAQDVDALQSMGIVDLEPEIDDFADTAAVIANLDLVICVDTSVAHLAGAMGKPVWIVLPFAPDFRWLAQGEASPWYPSARLFRQPASKDWDSVFLALAQALASFTLERPIAAENIAPMLHYDDEIIEQLRQAHHAMRKGDWRTMEAHCQTVLPHAPHHIEANMLLGIALCKSDRAPDGLHHLALAYEYWPQNPVLLKYLGLGLQSCGEAEQAAHFFLSALQFGNDDPEILFNLGVLRHLAGDLSAASGFYQAALAMKPNFAECLNNQGIVLGALGEINQAIEHFQKAIELAPDFFDPVLSLGNVLYQSGRIEEAKISFERAVDLRPDHAGAQNSLGVALKAQGEMLAAVASFERALQLDAGLYEARGNLGNALKHLGQLDQAIAQYREALAQCPENASIWGNLGNALQQQGKVEAALHAFDQALKIAPDNPEAHWNRALAWLLIGDYEHGWPEYEWGFAAGARPINERAIPRWQGENLVDKTLLVSAEQGLGDTLQFVRFLSAARARVGKLVFECQPALLGLLGECAGIDQIFPSAAPDSELPEIAARVPLMSLPGMLGVTLSQLPGACPYLRTAPENLSQFATLISTGDIKVGIVWAGSSAHQDDRNRSCDLRLFKSLAQVSGVQLYSLQKGPRAQDIEQADFPILDLSPYLNDFMDTAAAIVALDLVVSVDTAVLHLAAGLGKTTWVALPFAPDWRWGIGREDCPWYPAVRLFRQAGVGQWPEVFEQMAQAIKESQLPLERTS